MAGDSSEKDLLDLPVPARRFFGHALEVAKRGEQHNPATVLKGVSAGPACWSSGITVRTGPTLLPVGGRKFRPIARTRGGLCKVCDRMACQACACRQFLPSGFAGFAPGRPTMAPRPPGFDPSRLPPPWCDGLRAPLALGQEAVGGWLAGSPPPCIPFSRSEAELRVGQPVCAAEAGFCRKQCPIHPWPHLWPERSCYRAARPWRDPAGSGKLSRSASGRALASASAAT